MELYSSLTSAEAAARGLVAAAQFAAVSRPFRQAYAVGGGEQHLVLLPSSFRVYILCMLLKKQAAIPKKRLKKKTTAAPKCRGRMDSRIPTIGSLASPKARRSPAPTGTGGAHGAFSTKPAADRTRSRGAGDKPFYVTTSCFFLTCRSRAPAAQQVVCDVYANIYANRAPADVAACQRVSDGPVRRGRRPPLGRGRDVAEPRGVLESASAGGEERVAIIRGCTGWRLEVAAHLEPVLTI